MTHPHEGYVPFIRVPRHSSNESCDPIYMCIYRVWDMLLDVSATCECQDSFMRVSLYISMYFITRPNLRYTSIVTDKILSFAVAKTNRSLMIQTWDRELLW